MSDRNKPIYNLPTTTISILSVALHNPGKHWVLPTLAFAKFPVIQTNLGKYLPVVPYVRHVTKSGVRIEQTLHAYELNDGRVLLINPVAKYRKINGVMSRAKEDLQYLVPRNATSVYIIRAIYPENDFTLDNLTLEVTECTNDPLRHLVVATSDEQVTAVA